MFEEEQRLGKGFTISDERELDQLLLGANKKSGIQGINSKRPLSAYNAKSTSESDRYISLWLIFLQEKFNITFLFPKIFNASIY